MTHVHLQEYEDAFLMICGTVNAAAQAGAMVDCPAGCAKMYQWFNDGKELPR